MLGKLSDATESWTAGCGATPVPVSATDCGEPGAIPVALSARLSEAVFVPAMVGLKVTEMVHDALTASDEPQVLVCEYEAELLPVKETLAIVRAAVPVFLSVTAFTADE